METFLRRLSIAFFFFASAPAFAVTLDEAYTAALNRLETLRQSKERVVQAEERVRQARGGILPNVALNASHMIQPKLNDPLVASFFPERQTTVSLGLTQPLFRGLREFAGLRMQKDLAAAQEENHRQATLNLYVDVATNVLSILSFEQDLVNLREQADLYGKRVGELRNRARTGESSASEVLTAQSTQASLQAEIRVVESQLRNARETFTYLTGLPRDAALTDPALLGAKKAALKRPEDWFGDVEKRPDLKEAKLRLQAAEEDVSFAKGAHWPSLDLLGNYYFQRPEGVTEDLHWDVTFRLTFPLFEGGATQSKVREAASRRLEAELQLASQRRVAEQEIRSYFESAEARLDQIEALENAADLADRNSQVMQRDYRRGLARNIDVQQALTELRVARRALDQARFSAQLDYLRLRLAAARPPALLEGAFQ